jgi:hypothetical protein
VILRQEINMFTDPKAHNTDNDLRFCGGDPIGGGVHLRRLKGRVELVKLNPKTNASYLENLLDDEDRSELHDRAL